jgi:SAM-dependent methyltransferase
MSRYGGYEDTPQLAELYDLVPGYSKRPDNEFYVQYCQAADGAILELGCGTGRILLPVAEAGCKITGLDISNHMLEMCRRKIQSKPENVQNRIKLHHGDITDFNLRSKFQLAIMPFRAFQHLITVNEQLACLRCINKHLVASGKLVLDVFQVNLGLINNPRFKEENEDFPEYRLQDGRRLRRAHKMTAQHRAKQCNDVELIYYLTDRDGKTERLVQAFPFRYFFRYEIEHLLSLCGFKLTDIFGDFDRSPLDDKSPEMIFVAEKIE